MRAIGMPTMKPISGTVEVARVSRPELDLASSMLSATSSSVNEMSSARKVSPSSSRRTWLELWSTIAPVIGSTQISLSSVYVPGTPSVSSIGASSMVTV